MDEALSSWSGCALYLVFPAILAPFFVASLFFKTFPTKRLAILLGIVALAPSISFLLGEEYVPISAVFALDAILVVALLADFWTAALKGRGVTMSRRAETIASLDNPLEVEIIAQNRTSRPITLDIADDSRPESRSLPSRSNDDLLTIRENDADEFGKNDYSHFSQRTIEPGEQETLSYGLVWKRRGEFRLEFVAARFGSAAGFWRKYVKYSCESVFKVYPNLCRLEQFQTMGRASLLFLLGVRQMRRVGQDAEFERIRDYTQDDQYKFIDWKATARRNKLIVRDFQTTRNQRVIIMIDAGRTMMNVSGTSTLFDAALNSSLALAYIALKQGDEVGLLIFSSETRRFVPPRGGVSHMSALIRGAFDVFPERRESRYDLAFEYLARNSPKRALVVLATNVLDERNSDLIERSLINLAGAHLPLGLFLREHSLFDPLERYQEIERLSALEPEEFEEDELKTRKPNRLALWLERFGSEREPADEIDRLFWRDSSDEGSRDELLYRAGAAAEIINWRKKTLRTLEAKGALTLDVFPEDAATPLINKYLEIKARRLL